MDAVSTN